MQHQGVDSVRAQVSQGLGNGLLHLQLEWSVSVIGDTSGYAIEFQGQKSGFRAGFRPDSHRENIKISSPAGRSVGFDAFRLASGRTPSRKPISGPEALLHNIACEAIEAL